MQGRQTHSYMGNFSNGNNHIARQCTQPTKVRNSAWFKDKMLVAQVQDARIALSKERLAILADTGDNVDSGPFVHSTPSPANQDSMIMSVIEQMCNQVAKCNAEYKENHVINESLTAELERYKERIKSLEQRLNIDLNSCEKMIDSQMDDMIQDRLALKQQIDSLDQNLSNQIKEKESLLQTFTCSVDKNTFEIEKKELKLKNERLLEHIIYQDVMNIVMHADVKFDNVLPMPNAFFDDNIALEMMKMEYDRLMELLVS
ncbi:hypothetical protein Tco_0568182 [Tanacetum coccineum]